MRTPWRAIAEDLGPWLTLLALAGFLALAVQHFPPVLAD